MNRVQKQSMMIIINSLEQQLNALKGLLSIGSEENATIDRGAKKSANYADSMMFTSEEEDDEIGRAMELANEKKLEFIEDMFKEASKEVEHAPDFDAQ